MCCSISWWIWGAYFIHLWSSTAACWYLWVGSLDNPWGTASYIWIGLPLEKKSLIPTPGSSFSPTYLGECSFAARWEAHECACVGWGEQLTRKNRIQVQGMAQRLCAHALCREPKWQNNCREPVWERWKSRKCLAPAQISTVSALTKTTALGSLLRLWNCWYIIRTDYLKLKFNSSFLMTLFLRPIFSGGCCRHFSAGNWGVACGICQQAVPSAAITLW